MSFRKTAPAKLSGGEPMQEFEKKLMLTEQAYNYLRQAVCKDTPSVFQTNYYFDTDDFRLNKEGITCRVRRKNGVYKATVKNHGVQKLDCSIEKELSEKNYLDLAAFAFLGARLQGDLVTERVVMLKDNACEMVLDRNIYLGTADYELEIEYLLGFEEKAADLLNQIIDMLLPRGFAVGREETQSKSKSGRFFERKAAQERVKKCSLL